MENRKPLKRHPALVSYSREHHDGLLLVWKIRMGHKKEIAPARIGQHVVWCFARDLEPHFADEELFLLPLLQHNEGLAARFLQDHTQLRQLKHRIAGDTGDTALQVAFANLLEQHIRFEEREMFMYLQQHWGDDVLAEHLQQERAAPACGTEGLWEDEYWV